MTARNSRNDANGSGEQGDASGTTRRSVLKAAGAGAAALTVGSAFVGSASAHGMPTPPLERDGNKLVDPQCNEVILRGVNIADPVRMQRSWRTKTAVDAIDKAMNADEGWHNYVVRVPHTPQDISSVNNDLQHAHGDQFGPLLPGQFDQSDLETYFTQYVDPLVEQTKQNGAYIMLDYHRHYPVFYQPLHETDVPQYDCSDDSFENDLGYCGQRGVLWNGPDQRAAIRSLPTAGSDFVEDDTVAQALHDELVMFWSYVANEYADEPHVIFDVYNEPTGPYAGDWGSPTREPNAGEDAGVPPSPDDSAAEEYYELWVDRAQPWVDVVERNAPGSVKTIGSPRWSQYTYWADEHEFDATNMCYTGHAYLQEDVRPLTKYYGKPAENVPVFFSEWGWHQTGGIGDFFGYEGTTSEVAPEFEELFENYPVHPVAWNFDHTWEPSFFRHEESQDGDWVLKDYEAAPGQWWKEYLQEKHDEDRPQAPTDAALGGTDCSPDDGPELSVDLATDRVYPDGSVEARITLSEAPDGVAGYELVVSVADASVAEITGASLPDRLFDQGADIAEDGSSVTLQALDADERVQAGATDVVLGTITLEPRTAGETEVGVAVRSLDGDDAVGSVPVTATGDVLTVASISDVAGNTPRDLDGDGKYMDLNGNGELDADDVVVYFNNYDRPAITDHVSAYDFNDSGEVDFDDIVTLFQEY